MSFSNWLAFSAHLEQSLALISLVVAAWAFRRARRLPASFASRSFIRPQVALAKAPIGPSEFRWLAAIALLALALRTLAAGKSIPGATFGGEVMAFRARDAMAHEYWKHLWWESVRHANFGGALYDSPLLLPIVRSIQCLTGGGLHSIVWFGGFCGMAAVIACWWLARPMFGRPFALLWSSLLAVSPLQIAWGRFGYRATAAPPHVLFAAGLGYRAGQSSRWWVRLSLAVLTGIVCYLTVYNYEAARVAIPLAILCAALGAWRGVGSRGRRIGVGAAVGCGILLTVFACASSISRDSLRQTLWPQYGGYTGNKGESTLKDWFSRNQASIRREAKRSLADYFVQNRVNPPFEAGWHWGATYGGLVLAGVVILGALGIIFSLFRLRDEAVFDGLFFLWSLLLFGLALPALGCAAARRLLIFDIGWQGFAALGLCAIVAGKPFRALCGSVRGIRVKRREAGILAFGILVTGLYSMGLLAFLKWSALQSDFSISPGTYYVPFANGCVSDVVCCPRCLDLGTEWAGEIKQGSRVVLMDSDIVRENDTGPAGLLLFGHLAAQQCGRPGAFLDWYKILRNFQFMPGPGTFYKEPAAFGSWVRGEFAAGRYQRTIWQCERPNQWDWWMARQLQSLGGELNTYPTPLSRYQGFKVVVDASHDDAMVDFLSSLQPKPDRPAAAHDRLRIAKITERRTTASPPFLLFPVRRSAVEPVEWGAASWVLVDGLGWNSQGPWFKSAFTDAATLETIAVTEWGEEFRWTQVSAPVRTGRQFPALNPVRTHCGAYVNGAWWALDAETGQIRGSGVPAEFSSVPWIGVAAGADPQELLLLSPNQELVSFDLAKKKPRFRLPVRVLPQLASEFGECTQVVSGNGWLAILDQPAGEVQIYRRPSGASLPRFAGAVPITPRTSEQINAIAVQGHHLGIATNWAIVRNVSLDIDTNR